MTKSGSNHLFLLIKSLSKAEKRFFKVWARLYASERENKYIHLFNAIDKQKEHDEKKLLSEYKHIGAGNQFAVLKNHLYNQILKSMEQFYQSKYTEARSLLHRVEFLSEKGLYEQCEKILRKAKQKTEQNNMLHYSLELIRPWEKTLVFKRNDIPAMKRLLLEEENVFDQMLRSRKYQVIENKLYIYYLQSHGKKIESIIRQAKKLLQTPLMKSPEKISLFEDKVNFHWIYYMFYQIKRDIPNSYLHSKSMLQLFHHHPEKRKLHISTYLRVINNFLMTCIQLRKHEEIPHCLANMREVKSIIRPHTETAKNNFIRYANHSVLYYLETGKYQEGESVIKEIGSELKSYEEKLNDLEKATLYVNIALLCWGLNQLHACIDWVNKIRSEIKVHMRDDLKIFTDVFFIIVHYEAKHYELVASLVKSAMRMLKEKKKLYKVESLVLDCFDKIVKTRSQKEKSELFRSLKEELILLSDNPSEKQSFDYFDYISWVESKIENKPFAEVVRRKATK